MLHQVDDNVLDALVHGRYSTPFDVLGIHLLDDPDAPGRVIRTLQPDAEKVEVLRDGHAPVTMERIRSEGLFQAVFPDEEEFFGYRLGVTGVDGGRREIADPYRLGPALDEARLHAVLSGRDRRLWEVLGAHPTTHGGLEGTVFGVWAPNARSVHLLGSFNGWRTLRHPMRPRGSTGVWELFLPGVGAGDLYKFEIRGPDGHFRTEKADPVGFRMELRPGTASVVSADSDFQWTDDAWIEARPARQAPDAPLSVYEVHPGSWRRAPGRAPGGGPGWLTYRELADQLLPYVHEMGFTHVELLPVTEHPLDESWGYQSLGYFAPTSRFGEPDDFRHFVNRAHELGLGVILDWVPAHFPRDEHGLVYFDGTHLYEHADPRRGVHPDWGTMIFNYGREEVRAFLVASALFWLQEYHLDGLRVDAVASMLYLDYSREEGDWVPNPEGGRENLEAVGFLRELNHAVHEDCPGVLVVAEESTDWPRVSLPPEQSGLGFDLKWNMGWMNDTLEVMSKDPVYRKHEYDKLTFSIWYAFSERFLLPLSHDEVVHLKGSLLNKMPGPDDWHRFANLRLLLGYAWAHPGKQLLFMGGEFGQRGEWNEDGELEWGLLDRPDHGALRAYVSELNRLYRTEPALHQVDFGPKGFEWVDCHDPERTTLSFLRWSREWEEVVAVAANFTPVTRERFRLGVPFAGRYRLLLNSATGVGDELPNTFQAVEEPVHGRPAHVELDLPGLGVVYLKPEG